MAAGHLNRGDYQGALEIYDCILAKAPDDPGAHLNRGVALQYLNRLQEALASYEQAITCDPAYAEAYSNRGFILQTLGNFAEALADYDTAIALKPRGSFHSNRGSALKALGRLDEALASFDAAIALAPAYAPAHHNRGSVLQQLQRFEAALESFDRAIALKPDFAEAHAGRGDALMGKGDSLDLDTALASYDKAIALKPDYADAHAHRGNVLYTMKRYDDALASHQSALALRPARPDGYCNLGEALLAQGQLPQAEEMFQRSLAIDPLFPRALANLTKVRTYRDLGHPDLRTIQESLNRPQAPAEDRTLLWFALGKFYDDCGRYGEAFECFWQANQSRSAAAPYDPEAVSERTDRIIAAFNREFVNRPFAFASEDHSPLFIVGMPRSGTTLLANILSNHPLISTAGELDTIHALTQSLGKGSDIAYPEAVDHIAPEEGRRLAEKYLRRLRRDVNPGVVRVIDKYPMNFSDLGFIAMLFPNARIIHCIRNPLDTGVSNYFQPFSAHLAYSFDLANIGHFHGEYARLMQHWKQVLPVAMMDISYEATVTQTEAVARAALEWLGLGWDARCLAPHTNPCPVESASQWQVRQPIYGHSIGRWRHYEKHLGPLKEMLSRYGIAFGE